MKESFDKAFEFVIGAEGKLTDDPLDPGGLTKYGISHRAYPTKDIRNLTLDDAKAIYRMDYWDKCDCDDLPFPLDIAMFDTAVNMGVGKAKDIQMKSDNTIDGYLLIRCGEYAKLKNFSLYGRGWINRVLNLYSTFAVLLLLSLTAGCCRLCELDQTRRHFSRETATLQLISSLQCEDAMYTGFAQAYLNKKNHDEADEIWAALTNAIKEKPLLASKCKDSGYWGVWVGRRLYDSKKEELCQYH